MLGLSHCNGLTDLGPLSGLASLTLLNLSACKGLTDLGPLSGLASLTSLGLSGCKGLRDLQPLRGLASLTSLHLAGCGHLGLFEPIRERLPYLTEPNLAGSTFTDLAPEVYAVHHKPGMTLPEFDNVIDMVRAHYADLERGQQYDTEIKVFVLGNGGVGKSHLCNRLIGGEYPADPARIPSTHGIRITEFEFDIEASQPARINLWDFGQETRFLNFAGFDRRREVPHLVSGPPDPATVGKQVYLSYPWGEDTTKVGRLREQAARRTIELLTQAGYAVTYDRKDMRLGDLISAFITRIGTAQRRRHPQREVPQIAVLRQGAVLSLFVRLPRKGGVLAQHSPHPARGRPAER